MHRHGIPCTSREFPDFGLVLQAALRLGAHVAVVAEGNVYADPWDTAGPPANANRSNHVAAALAGPRWMTRTLTTWDGITSRLFVQVLAGPEVSTLAPRRSEIGRAHV